MTLKARGKALAANSRMHSAWYPVQRSAATTLRNRGLIVDASFDTGNANVKPGDPVYSPTDMVTQNPLPYPTARPETPKVQKGPGQSPGWWSTPTTVNPSQYVDQNVGGQRGDTRRMNYTQGIMPMTYFRQPFLGAVLTPPRPRVLVVGNVGRLGFRDSLALRVQASTSDFAPSSSTVANNLINPQLGW